MRKSDGLEIDDEDLFSDLINGKEEVWLIALEADEDYGILLFHYDAFNIIQDLFECTVTYT